MIRVQRTCNTPLFSFNSFSRGEDCPQELFDLVGRLFEKNGYTPANTSAALAAATANPDALINYGTEINGNYNAEYTAVDVIALAGYKATNAHDAVEWTMDRPYKREGLVYYTDGQFHNVAEINDRYMTNRVTKML